MTISCDCSCDVDAEKEQLHAEIERLECLNHAGTKQLNVMYEKNNVLRKQVKKEIDRINTILIGKEKLQAEIKKLKELISDLEFCEYNGGTALNGYQETYDCPYCHSSRQQGHDITCKIKHALAR